MAFVKTCYSVKKHFNVSDFMKRKRDSLESLRFYEFVQSDLTLTSFLFYRVELCNTYR